MSTVWTIFAFLITVVQCVIGALSYVYNIIMSTYRHIIVTVISIVVPTIAIHSYNMSIVWTIFVVFTIALLVATLISSYEYYIYMFTYRYTIITVISIVVFIIVLLCAIVIVADVRNAIILKYCYRTFIVSIKTEYLYSKQTGGEGIAFVAMLQCVEIKKNG